MVIVEDNLKKLDDFIQQQVKKPYEQNLLELLRSNFRSNPRDDNQSYFCSELMIDSYRKLGLFDDNGSHPNNFIPSDFADNGYIETWLRFGPSVGIIPD